MFGYVTIDKPELLVKEFGRYKAYYCGLCRQLRREYGFAGEMTLNYDMTFLVVLLTSLYESEADMTMGRCKLHPVKKIPFLHSEITDYAADMNVLLAWYQLIDKWKDDKKVSALTGTHILCKSARRVEKKYPRQAAVMKSALGRLQALERKGCTDIDAVAGCFGRLMAEVFVIKQDIWEETLREFGFYLGKFIYIMDAWDDLDEDLKSGSYNPLAAMHDKEGFEEQCQKLLLLMIGEACGAFERLPCLEETGILRNILYRGVWNKYHSKKDKIQEKKDHEQSI